MNLGRILNFEIYLIILYLAFAIYQVIGRPMVLTLVNVSLNSLRKKLLEGYYSPSIKDDATWKSLGGSSVNTISYSLPTAEMQIEEPVFRTLRVDAVEVSVKKWEFKIRFVLVNPLRNEIAIDDMHVTMYEKEMPTVPVASWIYASEVILTQDNSIWKDNRSFSLRSGDALEMVLVMEMTRYESVDVPGPVRALFGIFVDYCVLATSGEVIRKAIPSDCIYLFEYQLFSHPGANNWKTISPLKNDEFILQAINCEVIEELKIHNQGDSNTAKMIGKMEDMLKKHSSSRPIPRP